MSLTTDGDTRQREAPPASNEVDALAHLEQQLAASGRVVRRRLVDGRAAAPEPTSCHPPGAEPGRVTAAPSRTPREIAIEGLSEAPKTLERIVGRMAQAATLLRRDRLAEGVATSHVALEELALLVQLVLLAEPYVTPRSEPSERSAAVVLANEVLQQCEQAHAAERTADWYRLADLLAHDIPTAVAAHWHPLVVNLLG
jgi:hypothetical protein